MKKLLLSIALVAYAFNASAQTADLSGSYSGFGNMPIGMALGTVLPNGVSWSLEGVKSDANVKWNIQSGTISDALNEIASKNQLQWKVVNSQIVITPGVGFVAKKAMVTKATPQKTAVQKSLSSNETIVGEEISGVGSSGNITRTEVVEIIKPGRGVPDVAPPPKVSVERAFVETETSATVTATTTVPVNANSEVKTPTKTVVKEVVKEVVVESAQPVAVLTIPQAPAVKYSDFKIRLEDESVSLAIRRWASDAGWQLVWEAGKDFPSHETTYQTNDIITAIQMVMNDTASSNFPLHACVYDNKVIRILPIAQGCTRAAGEGA